MPERIQRKRTKGWRIPPNAIYVGRGTKWGNPFRVGDWFNTSAEGSDFMVEDRAHAVRLFREWCKFPAAVGPAIAELRGKDLACWCPLDQPCHADVLLEWANAPKQRP